MSVSTREHLEAIMDERREADRRVEVERDKATEQTQKLYDYEKGKSNQLREQIAQEKNLYVTKDELSAAIEKVEAVRGAAHINTRTFALAAGSVGVGVLGIVVAVLANAGIFG
jgi:hypothetical protein